ncbi:RIP metalloprotease RseP [Arenimonas sp.]|uniref:RIP metalloprotease RseP n=1 Tax=Arenimonas sp. TaxID=1872635 RepID=UPI0039E47D09
MSEFLGSLFWFIVTLGVLVTFHEFGHYWVARRCGVKVLRFSVGFGRALWSRTARDGTEYQVAMIPLGGYVKMLDDRETEVAPAERASAFNQQPPLKRIAIIAAGPIANLLLCVALLWAAFVIGVPGFPPMLGKTSGLAAEAGLREGDRILAIGGETTVSWDDALPALVIAAIDREAISLDIQTSSGERANRLLRLDRLAPDFDQTNPFGAMGLSGRPVPPAVVGSLTADAAATGKLQPGDEILSLGGVPVGNFDQIPATLQRLSPAGEPVSVRFRRQGRELTVNIAPKLEREGSETVRRLGIAPVAPTAVLIRHPVGAAMKAALRETNRQTQTILSFLGRLVTGQASTKNLSGAIGIAQAANAEASQGAARLLFFMASLSLTLCILNLLPIPALDGGHLLYYLTELISGRAVSERVLIAGQYAGLALLLGLILLANTNDVLRIFRIT